MLGLVPNMCVVVQLQILEVLCGASEYDDLPVRHNEDRINLALSREMRWRVDTRTPEDPHLKANLLLQVCKGTV